MRRAREPTDARSAPLPSPQSRCWRRTLGLLVGPLAVPAHAEGTASTFVAEGNLGLDGVFKVKQTVTFAGPVPGELSQKFETREDLVGDRQYVQELRDVSATAGGAAVNPVVETSGRYTVVALPTNGANEIVLNYTVVGAVVKGDRDTTALRWRMLQGLSAQVTEFRATVKIPAQFSYVKCTAGNPNATEPCRAAVRRHRGHARRRPSSTVPGARARSSASRSASRPAP